MINRHITLFVDNPTVINSCLGQMIEFVGSSFEKPFDVTYYPNEKHNLENCSGCKGSFDTIVSDYTEFFSEFPNCCKPHSKLTNELWFIKNDFKDLPRQLAEKTMFSHHHILNKLDEEDWKNEITNYLDYVIESFGDLPKGFGGPLGLSQYFTILIRLQEGFILEGENIQYKSRLDYILNYLKAFTEPVKKVNSTSQLNILVSIYDKWFKSFPFELEFFSDFKNHFSSTFPVLANAPIYNPYTGLEKAKFQTPEELVQRLNQITTLILAEIDTTELLENDYITNQQKYQYDLKIKLHKTNQNNLLKQFSKGEKNYIKTIKKWLEYEKAFMSDMAIHIKALPPVKKTIAKSFEYIDNLTKQSNLTDLMKRLIETNLIDEKTNLSDFRKIFANTTIQNKIIWTGTIAQLSYFIKQLHNVSQKVTPLKQKHWETTLYCFKLQDNKDLSQEQLRTQKNPTNTKEIENLIKTL